MNLSLSLYSPAAITADKGRRLISGTIVRYGVVGFTSAGPLKVRAGALRFPSDLGRVKLTREHVREIVTGFLTSLDDGPESATGTFRIAATPDGDTALTEADPSNRVRDGLSIDVEEAIVEGDEIVSARVVAVGQVGFPAFDDSRVSSVAAAAGTTQEGSPMPDQPTPAAPAQPAQAPDPAQTTTVVVTPPAPQPAPADQAPGQVQAASFQPVAPGVPSPAPGSATPTARTSNEGALAAFVSTIVAALRPGGGGGQAILAALNDVTHAQHSDNIEAPGWSGELWSGLQYDPIYTPLLSSGPLTNWEGHGWRWVVKPQIYDYTGNKAAVPSDTPTTEPSSYEAARMAVGHDIDRKFYDFPNPGFLQGFIEAVRESWAVKLDAKVHDFIVTEAVVLTGPDGGDVGTDPDPIVETSLFRAVAQVGLRLKRLKVGRPTFVLVSDSDWLDLIDLTSDDLPAYLTMLGVEPSSFVSSPDVPAGTVIGGARQAATVRTLPGSPIRVDAQHLANGGIDQAFFGYWAIEQHHTSGIMSATFA